MSFYGSFAVTMIIFIRLWCLCYAAVNDGKQLKALKMVCDLLHVVISL